MGNEICSNNMDNTKYSIKKEFMDIAKILQDQLRSLKQCELCKLKAYLITTKSLPIFLSLIIKYKILENLDRAPNEINEIISEKDFPEFEIKNLEIIDNFEQCKQFVEKNKDDDNGFIIVNDKFLEYMRIKKSDYKQVQIIIDNEKKVNEIKFTDSQNSQNILFKEKTIGIFEFTIIEVSAININNNTNNINLFGTSTSVNNINRILEPRKKSIDSNKTWDKLINEGSVKQDNCFLKNFQQQKNSYFSDKINNVVDSKTGP